MVVQQPEWMVTLSGGPSRRPPGRLPVRREVERAFWVDVARGLSTEAAAAACGVSTLVGARWFRERGGMPSIDLSLSSGRYLTFAEREEIALLRAAGCGVRGIARQLGRSPSTICRELRRNAVSGRAGVTYRAGLAQWKAELLARRPKPAKLATNDRLRDYVQDRLAGKVRAADGTVVAGPTPPPFNGRKKPHRGDRRWSSGWSPQQIATRLTVDFPEDESMRISHEAIYQALYVQSRGALKREMVACLRTGRAVRMPQARTRSRPTGHVTRELMISERPAEVADRAVPGHWEGDLIIGSGHSAIGTLVERSTRFTMLLHLPRMAGYGETRRVPNGPALAGRGAEAMREAIAAKIVELPEHLRRSLTWDRGTELAQHAQLTVDTNVAIYFADPHSPWQRGTNENTNGLLRQYFPKGTDLARWTVRDIEAVAATLNARPRKTLGWKTPAEALDQHLQSVQQPGVATTG